MYFVQIMYRHVSCILTTAGCWSPIQYRNTDRASVLHHYCVLWHAFSQNCMTRADLVGN
jgi:hypothetical protein